MKNIFKVFAILAIIGFLAACSNGDDPLPAHTHEWEWVVTTPATPDADGVETETCKTCGQTNGTRTIPKLPEQPVATTYDLTMGDIKITLHYKKKPSEPVPAYVAKIQDTLNIVAIVPGTLMSDLTSRNGNYSINVIYDSTPFDGFLATDGQTLKAHNTWLTANAETMEPNQIMPALRAMLALPALDENGVPYYSTLPNTTIKIYKGEGVTDVEMTTTIANITKALSKSYLMESESDVIKNNVKKIQVNSSETTATFEKENGKYTVIIPANAGDTLIANTFYDILDEITGS